MVVYREDSGGTSGGTSFGKSGHDRAAPVVPIFPYLIEMARLGVSRRFVALRQKWLKRPLLYH